jgi:hypothetical protein
VPATDQQKPDRAESPLETVVVTRLRDLVGGFKVRRALPSARRWMVGPFIFLDQIGPKVLRSGSGLDVAAHPHIGLATVTYLFEGELLHRDSSDLERFKGQTIYLRFHGYFVNKATSVWYYYLVNKDGLHLPHDPWISVHRSIRTGQCALTGIFLYDAKEGTPPMPKNLITSNDQIKRKSQK